VRVTPAAELLIVRSPPVVSMMFVLVMPTLVMALVPVELSVPPLVSW